MNGLFATAGASFGKESVGGTWRMLVFAVAVKLTEVLAVLCICSPAGDSIVFSSTESVISCFITGVPFPVPPLHPVPLLITLMAFTPPLVGATDGMTPVTLAPFALGTMRHFLTGSNSSGVPCMVDALVAKTDT